GPDPYGLLLSRDSRQTWVPNLALSFPTFAGVDALSLSPAFASDGTAVASATLTETLFRSTDGGVQWDPWAPPIAYTAEINGQRDIVFMETPGGADRRLTTDGADDENPTWSPAWTYIAFQSNRGGNWDIFTIRAGCDVATLGEEACGLRQLTDDPA
ncbi:MAG: PD40 domain-containing protein, partial [Caldilineaceae bacterium]|nr:PD40 domain-containing protein [Caldilineaceae bacterium]